MSSAVHLTAAPDSGSSLDFLVPFVFSSLSVLRSICMWSLFSFAVGEHLKKGEVSGGSGLWPWDPGPVIW